MDHNFPEALDALIVDGSFIRRSINKKKNDKYIFAKGKQLFFNNLESYIPTNEDIFADDWQIFGKGVLGTGNNRKDIVDMRHGKEEK